MTSKNLKEHVNSFIRHQKWNKFPHLEINSIEMNSKKNLMTFATNSGFRVYDLKTFTLLSSLDGNQELIGNIMKANVLYSSSIIVLLGADNNNYYKCNQIFFLE